jgi:hypothetical protein
MLNSLQLRKNQIKSRILRDELIANPYTPLGGYPRFAITSDGAVLCHRCCNTESQQIGTTTGTDGWGILALETNWEDPNLYCSHCGERIESAYAE